MPPVGPADWSPTSCPALLLSVLASKGSQLSPAHNCRWLKGASLPTGLHCPPLQWWKDPAPWPQVETKRPSQPVRVSALASYSHPASHLLLSSLAFIIPFVRLFLRAPPNGSVSDCLFQEYDPWQNPTYWRWKDIFVLYFQVGDLNQHCTKKLLEEKFLKYTLNVQT